MPDSTSAEDCYRIAQKYDLLRQFPQPTRELFERHALEETPKSDDPAFSRSRWWTLLSNGNAVESARAAAESADFVVRVDNSCDDWDYERAAGYLLKSEPPERIVSFLRGVAQGEAALSGAVARRLLDQVRESGARSTVVPDSIAQVLSARELEVLLLLDRHLGTDEIATRLFISEHTVRSHVKSLLAKLGVSSRREALERLEQARG